MTCAWTSAGPLRARHYAAASRSAVEAREGVAAVHLARRGGSGTSARAARCSRRRSAPRPGPRSRSRCPRQVERRAACRLQAVLSDSQNSPSRRRAVAGRAVDDLVGAGRRRSASAATRRSVQPGLGAADRLEELRAGRDDCVTMLSALVAPVRRHLPAAGARVVLRADAPQEHLEGVMPELQAERAVAVVGEEPVVARLEDHAGRGEHRLVAGAADLEEDLVLPLELDLLVVDPPRQVHVPVGRNECARGRARGSCRRGLPWPLRTRIYQREAVVSCDRPRRRRILDGGGWAPGKGS